MKTERPDFLKPMESDTGEAKIRLDTALLNRQHIGLVAQELKQVYPELVYTNEAGIMSINYTGFIPVLIQALKEQQEEIQTIKANCCNKKKKQSTVVATGTTNDPFQTDTGNPGPSLAQNQPNPFTENTKIKYFLPESNQSASIYIYNMQGRQIDVYVLHDKDHCQLLIQGNSLQAGMYFYTLIADGQEVETRKMILTD